MRYTNKRDTPPRRIGDPEKNIIAYEHGAGVAPGEQISPFGDGRGNVPAVDKMMKKKGIIDEKETSPESDASADGMENLTESQEDKAQNNVPLSTVVEHF